MKLTNPTDDQLDAAFGDIVPIPGFDGYLISRRGVIWRTHFKNRNCNRKFNPPVRMSVRGSNVGYPRVSLTKNGTQKTYWLHQLVLLAFSGPRQAGFIARHKNGIRTDCRAENLEWSTPRNNYDDMILHGTVTAGTRNGNAKMTDSKVTKMRELKAQGSKTRQLAKHFGLSRTAVQKICSGKMWRHLPLCAHGVEVEFTK